MASRLDNLLDTYKSKINDLFANELTGIYLTGSIVFGEFFEGKSDVDCTVLLKSPLSIDKLEAVKTIHKNISIQYKNIPLESQYISCDNIGKSGADTQPFYSCLHDNEISLGKHNANEVTWFTLKKHGITVMGVPAGELDITTSVSDIKSYVKSNVNSYWKNWLYEACKPISQKRIIALGNWAIEWCICGITRMYYTMIKGDITSKGKAVEYGLSCLPESNHKILHEALRIRYGEKNKFYNSRFVRRKDMIDYMNYLIELINNIPVE